MKKYHVYAFGNAIVDIQVPVPFSLLNSMGIEKGVGGLVSLEEQKKVLDALTEYEHSIACGGSAANTGIAVSQLGGRSYFAGKVAPDQYGGLYAQSLSQENVDSNVTMSKDSGVTGSCAIMITPDAQRTMRTYLGITETLCEKQIVEEALTASHFLFMEGYLASQAKAIVAAKKSIILAKKAGVQVAFSFSDPAMVEYCKEGLLDIMQEGLDILFCNEEEAHRFTHTKNTQDAIPILKKYTKNLVITRGEKGSFIFCDNDCIQIAPLKVQALDTTGAGDAYAGALLYALSQGKDYSYAGNLASFFAAQVVAKRGPRLSHAEAVQTLENFLKMRG
ncbi:MAG: adenosine kinase [Bacteriovoracaceae bacterium]|nr:adenosine kinase [Bacteriovoracaceae bacterium]